jgi:nucleotidyltransferase substrate binding protein (TIGR01987 family)
MTTADIRWKQRLENFERAVRLLREPIERGVETLSTLEQEGTVQRFEVALELAWKTLKDYLEAQGAEITPMTPRMVVKTAFSSRVLTDAQIWIDMLDHRNLLSHPYDEATFEQAVRAISERYFPAIDACRQWLLSAAADDDGTPCVQLNAGERTMMESVFQGHAKLTGVILFGSRAKGNAAASSDVDLALEGVDDVLMGEAIRRELEDLPLPYRFDVQCLDTIKHQPLREHIDRVGVRIWERK